MMLSNNNPARGHHFPGRRCAEVPAQLQRGRTNEFCRPSLAELFPLGKPHAAADETEDKSFASLVYARPRGHRLKPSPFPKISNITMLHICYAIDMR